MSSGINLSIPADLAAYLTPYPNTEIRELSQDEVEEWTSGFGTAVNEKYGNMKKATITVKGIYAADPTHIVGGLPEPTTDDLEYVRTVRDLCMPIIKRLDSLPSPKAIAHFLRDERVLGKNTDPRDCPLANYFTAMTQHDVEVHTDCLAVTRSFERSLTSQHGARMKEIREMRIAVSQLPTKLQKFVSRFDGGKYSYLRRSA